MDHHTLSDDAFGALAAGRPSRATLDELRRAELGRHLLVLCELARAVPAARDDLIAAAADPAALADPLRAARATATLRAVRSGEHADPASPAHPTGGHRLSTTHAGLTLTVRLEDADPARRLLGLAPTDRLPAVELAHWRSCLAEAWRIIVDRHRADAETLAGVLRVIVPVRPDPAARGISATSADAYGAVAISAPRDGRSLAVGLLHETGHSLLNAVQHLFDLHRATALGYSPWRDDPRPATGILHGAYAYLAVVRFWRTERTVTGRLGEFEFARWRSAVADAATELLAGARLTAAGVRFVTALRAEVEPWLAEPADPTVVRLAAGANADHRLRWRLRTMRVDPADAAALAAAWRAGGPLPAAALRSELVPAPRRALESSPRLELVHRMLGGRAVDPAADRGDRAYLSGDTAAALRAYSQRIRNEDGDDAAWAGLALAAGLGDHRIELAAAAYRALTGRTDRDAPENLLRLIR